MSNFLANKKMFFTFVIFFVSIIIYFSFFYHFNNKKYFKKNIKSNNLETEQIIIQKIAEKDSDGDGLKDWQEKLWKTDPHNPDTDGDGTSDGEEVKEGRNPLIPGPNDYIKNTLKVDIKNNKKLTKTDIISRELLGGYLNLKKSNSFNKENETKLVDNIIKNNFSNDIKVFSEKDININNKNDLNSLKIYSDKLITILKQNSDFENNLIVLKKALENNDKNELNKLNKTIIIYKKMQNNFLKLSVPSDFALIQLDIINLIEKLINDTQKMLNVFNDPIPTVIGVKDYLINQQKIVEDFRSIWNLLKKKGVILNF